MPSSPRVKGKALLGRCGERTTCIDRRMVWSSADSLAPRHSSIRDVSIVVQASPSAGMIAGEAYGLACERSPAM